MTLTLSSPITEEQWDAITDVDFDHTDRIFFYTKHGKEVEFVKAVRCKDCKHYVIHTLFGNRQGWCERLCDEFDKSLARGTEEDDFCSRAEERTDG